jgi:hypothetical protein
VRRDARAATPRWHRPAQRVPRLGHQRSGVPPKAPALCSMRHSPARAGVPRAAARERASSPSTGSPLRRYSNSTERASRQMRDSALLLAHAEGGHRTASRAPPGGFVSARPGDETRLSARGHGSREAFRRVADRTTPPVVICVPSDQVERLNPSFQNTGANGIPLARRFSEVGWLGRLRGRCEPTVEDCGCASGDDYPLAHDFDAD